MNPLSSHPALHVHTPQASRATYQPPTDAEKLAVHLRHIMHLDPTAVYHVVGDSTVVYYHSQFGKPVEPGQACRLVLAPDGDHRRIGIVDVDPRMWAPTMTREEV